MAGGLQPLLELRLDKAFWVLIVDLEFACRTVDNSLASAAGSPFHGLKHVVSLLKFDNRVAFFTYELYAHPPGFGQRLQLAFVYNFHSSLSGASWPSRPAHRAEFPCI